jgi:polyisoprenyl-phosphate glycosyltransferase
MNQQQNNLNSEINVKQELCIIVPCYNEEGNLELLINSITKVINNSITYQILLVNDGSKDKTWELISTLAHQHLNISGINLSRNFGKEYALLAGIENAPLSKYYLTMDADLQDDPAVIKSLIDEAKKGNSLVYGQRESRNDGLLYVAFTKLFYAIMAFSTKDRFPNNVADYYVFDNQVRDAFLQMGEYVRYTRGLIFYTGFKTSKVMYTRQSREAGQSSFNFIKLVGFAIDAITSFTTAPLHLISVLGLVSCIFSFLGGLVYIFISIILKLNVLNGWVSLFFAIVFLGSVQILMLGIIAEYLARNTSEIKNRPKYFISEKIAID